MHPILLCPFCDAPCVAEEPCPEMMASLDSSEEWEAVGNEEEPYAA